MAGGKVSARQKMINMMYLVLTALLALNVSKEIIKAINEFPESRREWLLNKMSFAADRIKRNSNFKVWQDGFHPVILDTPQKLEQRLKYVHDNPMELQLVSHPMHWLNSSYLAYTDEVHQSNVELDVLFR